jgi:dTDP-3-amino-3,4,6-trideoxy-alpha-D-glucose transaminase
MGQFKLNIPYNDLSRISTELGSSWLELVQGVIDGGQFVGGGYVKKFEVEWANYIGVNHAIGVANGLDAISISLSALGIGHGDYVAVPAHTFIATWFAIANSGATPIGIDCDEFGSMNLDLLFESSLSFAAVIPVHMHGLPVDMPRLLEWATLKKVLIIEDAAQAHGARIQSTNVGAWGNLGAFSLYPTKNLGALGDAGIITTNDENLARSIREIANYGSTLENRYTHKRFGVNSRLDSLQAGILSLNLRQLDKWNNKRRSIAKTYLQALEKSSGDVRPLHGKIDQSVWHHFVVVSQNRDNLRAYLAEKGIGTEIHYPRLAASEYYEIAGSLESISSSMEPSFPMASSLCNTALSIPLNPGLDESQIEYIADSLSKYD